MMTAWTQSSRLAAMAASSAGMVCTSQSSLECNIMCNINSMFEKHFEYLCGLSSGLKAISERSLTLQTHHQGSLAGGLSVLLGSRHAHGLHCSAKQSTFICMAQFEQAEFASIPFSRPERILDCWMALLSTLAANDRCGAMTFMKAPTACQCDAC